MPRNLVRAVHKEETIMSVFLDRERQVKYDIMERMKESMNNFMLTYVCIYLCIYYLHGFQKNN